MPSVLDRRCGTCKLRGTHTRGIHVVEHEASMYFCSSKCRRLHGKRNRWAYRRPSVPRIALAAAEEASTNTTDWSNLPGDIVWRVQETLGLHDLLSMALSCKAWAMTQNPMLKQLMLEPAEDAPRDWGHALHLMTRLFPHVRQATCNLPDSDSATQEIQVLSRCTQVEHLTVTVDPSNPWWDTHGSRTWLPALCRMSALRTLTLEAPDRACHHLSGLPPMPRLTSLRLLVSGLGELYSMDKEGQEGEAADALVAAPNLVVLEAPENVLPMQHLTRLTALTSLAITNLFIDPYDLDSTHARDALPVIASLPRLARLSLATPHSGYGTRCHSHSHQAAHEFLQEATRHLRHVPWLSLDITSSAMLKADHDTLQSLAALTNLTALSVEFVEWVQGSAELAQLRTLRQLKRLSLSVWGHAANGTSFALNEPEIRDSDMRVLCRGLVGLEVLVLGLRPWWFMPIHALRHLTQLVELQQLELVLPEDTYTGRVQDIELGAVVPASYVPGSVERLQLQGYQLVQGA